MILCLYVSIIPRWWCYYSMIQWSIWCSKVLGWWVDDNTTPLFLNEVYDHGTMIQDDTAKVTVLLGWWCSKSLEYQVGWCYDTTLWCYEMCLHWTYDRLMMLLYVSWLLGCMILYRWWYSWYDANRYWCYSMWWDDIVLYLSIIPGWVVMIPGW